MNFVDNHSDLNTLDYLSKSINPEVMEKALSHTGLVQKEVQVQGKNGKTFTRKQWVKAGEESSNEKSQVNQEKPEKRKQVPATPFNLTERTKHLVPVENLEELPQFIKELDKPIPPNWRNVMVSTDPNAEVLAVGKDDMDRPQYIYNKEYVEKGKAEKFERVNTLMEHKDTLISAISHMKDRDTADCLNLILQMGIRPGSTRDTKSKVEALGATTLRGENVVEENGKVYLRFIGKKGVNQDHVVPSKELSEMLLKRKQQAGDKGDLFDTTDTKLRKALKPLGVKPKDLRTMLATSTAKEWLSDVEPTEDAKEFAKIRNSVGEAVCKILGNQRSMALNAYINPQVFEQWSPQGMKNWQQSEIEKKSKKSNKEVAVA